MAGSRVFIDSSAFIALFNRHDQHHGAAKKMFRPLSGAAHLATSDYVLDEVVTFLNARIGHDVAVRAAQALLHSDRVSMIVVTRDVIDRAQQRFAACAIPRISFTDITTSIIVDLHHIDRIFTFDGHFAELGHAMVGKE